MVSYTLLITGSGGVQAIPITDPTYTPTDALDFGFYTWTVQAHDAAGNVNGYTSPPSTFTLEAAGSKVYLPIVVSNK